MINSGKTVEEEIKDGLLEVGSKKRPIMIADDQESPTIGSKRKAESEEPAGVMLPPKMVPKSKKAPFPPEQEKEGAKKAEVKAMPKKQEEMVLPERSKPERSEPVARSKPEDSAIMPKGIEVELDQAQWSMMSKEARSRILVERPSWKEGCFYCGSRGHRAFYCKSMLQLGTKLTKILKQHEHGGSEQPGRKESIFCSSCWWRVTTSAVTGGANVRKASGWWSHSRNTCNRKTSCPLAQDSDLLRMSNDELRRRLAENGLEIGQVKKEKEEEPRPRSISVVSESSAGQPEKKRKRKKEEKKQREEEEKKRLEMEAKKKEDEDRKQKEKEEEDRKRKEAEEFKETLRAVSKQKLHGYLFDNSYRCDPSKMEQQAKYERKLPYEVLVRTPNYVSRLEELSEYNKSQIEAHNARMLREEQEAEKKKKEKEARKAARKDEKMKAKEEEKKKKAALKAAKKEKKKKE